MMTGGAGVVIWAIMGVMMLGMITVATRRDRSLTGPIEDRAAVRGGACPGHPTMVGIAIAAGLL